MYMILICNFFLISLECGVYIHYTVVFGAAKDCLRYK